MHLSDQGLIVILVVGIVAGWLAGKVVSGSGFGLVGDAAIGIVGALIGDWLLHRLEFISAPDSLASSSTPQSERLCSCSPCDSRARTDGAVASRGVGSRSQPGKLTAVLETASLGASLERRHANDGQIVMIASAYVEARLEARDEDRYPLSSGTPRRGIGICAERKRDQSKIRREPFFGTPLQRVPAGTI